MKLPARRPTHCCALGNRSPPSAKRKWPARPSPKSAAIPALVRGREAGRRAGTEACPLLTIRRRCRLLKRASCLLHLPRKKSIVVAVSGGPDSTALLWLTARWRASRKAGPDIVAVTIDHGLRAESAREAKAVKRLARDLGITHHTLRWSGAKPKTGLQEAARDARYACWRKPRPKPARVTC